MADTAHIVKSGTWLYDETVSHEVWIVEQNFDYHYDEGYEDAPEKLNSDGVVFQILIAKDGAVKSVLSACHTMQDAVAKAEQAIPRGIVWDDRRLQPLFGGRDYRISD